MNIYGVLEDGAHIDVSKTERGAKCYATRNGFDTVTIRYNCGYVAQEICRKGKNDRWFNINLK